MTDAKCFVFRFADVEVRERELSVTRAGERVSLEPKPFRVLQYLLHNPQRLITKAELLDAVWKDVAVTENSPARAVAQLRRALGDDIRDPRFIATVNTAGYRFVCPVEATEDVTSRPDPPVQPVPLDTPRETRWRRWVLLCASVFLITGLTFLWVETTHSSTSTYKYTHLASNLRCGIEWSPDGRAIAYANEIDGIDQLFVRYLNSPVAIQLTHEAHKVYPLRWTPDGSHILFFEPVDAIESDHYKLFSAATVGGQPEYIMSWTGAQADMSPDGKAFAIFTKGDGSEFGVQVSDPIGSPFKWYPSGPFATKTFMNLPGLDFEPDGKSLLLTYIDEHQQFRSWSLPYPAGSQAPSPSRLSLPEAASFTWSWMPDRRHIVASWVETVGAPTHLWMWDTESQERTTLTGGVGEDILPRVSPDGSRLVFAKVLEHSDLTEISLVDGSTTTLLSSGRHEIMASWSPGTNKLIWVSDRNGPFEIWLREPDGTQRPVITAADFPPGTNKFFLNPAISPDGNRVIYGRIDQAGTNRLWVSSLSGGKPVLLTNAPGSPLEWSGSWSPDGRRFVYPETRNDRGALMIINTGGGSTPKKIVDSPWIATPAWSPEGDWIVFQDAAGWHLISPDGNSTKLLGKFETRHLAFSSDGKMLYGLQEATVDDPRNLALFSIDIATLRMKKIKKLEARLAPFSLFDPGIRYSLSPDGKHFVYSTNFNQSDLWLMEGLQKPGWLPDLTARMTHIFKSK